MKIRLTISMIAFSLAVVGMAVRAHTCATAANSVPAATKAINYQGGPSYSGFTASATPVALTDPAFTHSGALTLEEGAGAGTMTVP